MSAKPNPIPGGMDDIRPATQNDLQTVFELNLVSFAEAWSYQSFIEALTHDYELDVWRTTRGKLAAYYLGHDVLDEVHVMQLAVAPAFRRQGLGARLTRYILDKKHRKGMRRIWLEVRASNMAAQHLYTGLGFRSAGRRKDYYAPRSSEFSREDALVMRYDLQQAQAN